MGIGYNGWPTYETWNVALWIGNDESLHDIALQCRRARDPYATFIDRMSDLGIVGTGDDVRWDDPQVDYPALNENFFSTLI